MRIYFVVLMAFCLALLAPAAARPGYRKSQGFLYLDEDDRVSKKESKRMRRRRLQASGLKEWGIIGLILLMAAAYSYLMFI